MQEKDLQRLNYLPSDARARVEAALTETLEREIASASLGPGAAAAFSRSKGLAFSKSKVTSLETERIRSEIDATVLRNLEQLDDEKFARFAERITSLRSRSS
jgi:hypothetical protein